MDTNRDKVKTTAIKQVCIVVDDIQNIVDKLWNILGIGQWVRYTFGSPVLRDRRYYGKLTWGWEKGAIAQVGPMEFELFATVEGASVYKDWVDEYGEELHHIKFITGDMDVDRTSKLMNKMGFTTIASARFGPPEYKRQYAYFDTADALGCVWETSSAPYPRVWPPGTIFYPDASEPNLSRINVKGITQIGLVVHDINTKIENYRHILGINSWDIVDWESPLISERRYHGEPASGRDRVATAQVSEIELELCQPLEGRSIFKDFLDRHGEGLYYLTLLVDDVDGTAAILAERGFPSIFSGSLNSVEAGAFNFIDVKPLHCVFKLKEG